MVSQGGQLYTNESLSNVYDDGDSVSKLGQQISRVAYWLGLMRQMEFCFIFFNTMRWKKEPWIITWICNEYVYTTILVSMASVRKCEGSGWLPHVPFKCYKNNTSLQRKAYFSFCRCNSDTPVFAILCIMDICGESCWKNLSAPLPSSASKHHWSEHFLSMDSRT